MNINMAATLPVSGSTLIRIDKPLPTVDVGKYRELLDLSWEFQ